jgi:hypothetical protein
VDDIGDGRLQARSEARRDLGPGQHDQPLSFWGGAEVIVPDGVEVEIDSAPIMGGTDVRLSDVPPAPDAPVIRINAISIMGGATISEKPGDGV